MEWVAGFLLSFATALGFGDKARKWLESLSGSKEVIIEYEPLRPDERHENWYSINLTFRNMGDYRWINGHALVQTPRGVAAVDMWKIIPDAVFGGEPDPSTVPFEELSHQTSIPISIAPRGKIRRSHPADDAEIGHATLWLKIPAEKSDIDLTIIFSLARADDHSVRIRIPKVIQAPRS